MRSVVIAVAFFALAPEAPRAADLRLLAVPPLRSSLEELLPRFERETGHRIATRIDLSAVFRKQIEGGEPFDAAILAVAAVDELAKSGRLVASTRADIARAALAVAVRKGAPRVDVGSLEGFRRALLGAQRISWSPQGTSGAHIAGLLERLGIATDVKPKLLVGPTGQIASPVSKGEADLALLYVPGILLDPGVEMAGLFPPELQNYDLYTGALGEASREKEAALSLLRYLVAPAAAEVFRAKGLEPAPR